MIEDRLSISIELTPLRTRPKDSASCRLHIGPIAVHFPEKIETQRSVARRVS